MRRVSDLNVTPMIDVLLVLLVIFMAALPLSQRGLDVTLPATEPSSSAPLPDNVVLEYTADRAIAINKQTVAIDALEGRLREIYESRRDKTLYLMGSGTLRYGEIVQVIDAARGAGVGRVGVITERIRQR